MKQLSEQKMPISLQTENTGEDIQEEKPGSSTTGLTAEEEERLAFLDDYFAAGLNHTDGWEENLIKLREQKKECRSKIRQAKRLSVAAVSLASAGVILGILSMAVLQKQPAAVFGGLTGIAGVAVFFWLRRRTAQYKEQLEGLNGAEEKERTGAAYAKEYQTLSQKEEFYKQIHHAFQEQQREEKCKMLEKQQIQVLQKKRQTGQQKKQIEHRMEVLEKSMQYLTEAKQAYISHMAKDLSEPFYAYLSAFDEELGRKVQLNDTYEIGIVDHGILRQMDYYSSGIKDVIWFCERMAFIQRLSVKEKPVIVLDDIFLALDNQMQKKAFNMIGRISQDFQIIYLSCHEYAVL